jgi:hypothetical protein
MRNTKPWSFCETPEEKCTMNYCDDNGCQNRKRNYVEGNEDIAGVINRVSDDTCMIPNCQKISSPLSTLCNDHK